jgi:hypothetical protein
MLHTTKIKATLLNTNTRGQAKYATSLNREVGGPSVSGVEISGSFRSTLMNIVGILLVRDDSYDASSTD